MHAASSFGLAIRQHSDQVLAIASDTSFSGASADNTCIFAAASSSRLVMFLLPFVGPQFHRSVPFPSATRASNASKTRNSPMSLVRAALAKRTDLRLIVGSWSRSLRLLRWVSRAVRWVPPWQPWLEFFPAG